MDARNDPRAIIDRRRILAEVRDGIDRRLTPNLASEGFKFVRRDALYRRDRDGVEIELRLGIASRPPSMGRTGILIEPIVTASVPVWMAEAKRRLDVATARLASWEAPTPAFFELLDWLVPGKAPHWTLPDEPTRSEMEGVVELLCDPATRVFASLAAHLATPQSLLDAVATGIVQVPSATRFTVACGAILQRRPDLATSLIEPFGTARRASVAELLGLNPASGQ